MKKPTPLKPTQNAHTANTKIGMGDYYGSGIKAKLGRIRDVEGMNPLGGKKMKTPPKSLA